jgi:tRNA-specific 2-thiouridylase
MNWFRESAPDEPVFARIRHRGALIPCVVEGREPTTVRFAAPARAVAAGQAVVLYQGDAVLGGGWIREALS